MLNEIYVGSTDMSEGTFGLKFAWPCIKPHKQPPQNIMNEMIKYTSVLWFKNLVV